MGLANTFSNRFIFIFLLAILVSSKVHAQTLTKKQQDSAFLLHPGQECIRKIKKSLAKTFVNFKGNDLSLYGSLNLSKQKINDNGITAPINYLYNNLNNNSYEARFSGGFRMDGVYDEKHHYSFSFGINRITVGNYYQNIYSLEPFIDDFTHFKADNVFTTINIAAHYKKLLPVGDMNKYKFYAVIGPSFDYKISSISEENLINGAGNKSIINGDFGAEFDNKGYYVLFAHYKYGVNMKSSSVPIQLNRFEIGMSIKTKDLF
jgi:hypothetical protein